MEIEEEEPEVAAAPPTVRVDRAVIRLGQLKAYLNHSRCLLFMFFRHFVVFIGSVVIVLVLHCYVSSRHCWANLADYFDLYFAVAVS